MKKLLMGNEAIALGAIRAGVKVVSGYPGTPSTEVLETVAKHNPGDIYVEWSTNEKVGLEVAAGASFTGARSMVTMKQVGLNVASDPLMSLVYLGVKGGMVVLVADDPGPLSSQTEQDTRHFAKYANIPIFDPSSPEEAYEMIQEAFELSEELNSPVFVRPTTRVCHACSTIEVPDDRKVKEVEGFVKDPKWVIFPPLAYRRHVEIEQTQERLDLSNSPFNCLSGEGSIGIAAGGVSYRYVKEIVDTYQLPVKVLKIGTPYPMPEKICVDFMRNLEKIIVVEELDPVIEEALTLIANKYHFYVTILGKKTHTLPFAGEFTYETVLKALRMEVRKALPEEKPAQNMQLPARPPVLCAGCPHRASFYAVKLAAKGKKAIFTGDIGCYTLGNAKPLEMTDTCLCMGAGITVAQGIKRAEPDAVCFAFVGDSTFFHTGMPGVADAVYNGTDINIVVLDNSTTAMTGHQPHPGIGKTMMGTQSKKIDIYSVVKAMGVEFVERANPFDLDKAVEVCRRAAEHRGVSVVLFEAPCIALLKPEKIHHVDPEKCKACGKCIREIGCPAMYLTEEKKVQIEPSLCYGCGLCENLCAFDAIGGRKR